MWHGLHYTADLAYSLQHLATTRGLATPVVGLYYDAHNNFVNNVFNSG